MSGRVFLRHQKYIHTQTPPKSGRHQNQTEHIQKFKGCGCSLPLIRAWGWEDRHGYPLGARAIKEVLDSSRSLNSIVVQTLIVESFSQHWWFIQVHGCKA